MTHSGRCHCADCARLDKRWPHDGHQLRLIDQTPEQRAPSADEAAARLFELAGLRLAGPRQSGFDL
jgi:hypothetical protein